MLTTVEGRVGFTVNVEPRQQIGQQINFSLAPWPSDTAEKPESGNNSGNSFSHRKAM